MTVRRALNLIAGSGVTVTPSDNLTTGQQDWTIAASGVGSTVTFDPVALNGTNQSAVKFGAAIGSPTVGQDLQTADVVPAALVVQAQTAFGGASVNTTGGILALFSGDNRGSAGRAGWLLKGGTLAAPVIGQIQARSSGVGGVPDDPSVQHIPWSWTTATVSVVSGTNNPLTIAQSSCPVLVLTGTLTGAGTVLEFPNVAGFWICDISGMSGFSGTNVLSMKSGSTTVTVINTSLSPGQGDDLIIVITTGANGIKTLGSTLSPL